MESGSSAGRRLLAVCAVLCAIGGVVLAAGAMAPLASVSPASDFVEDQLGERAAAESTDGPMAAGDSAGESMAGGGSGGSGGATGSGIDLGGSSLISSLLGGSGATGNPLLGGLLGELLSLSGGAGGSGGGGTADGSETGSTESDGTDGGSEDGESTETEAESGGGDSQATGENSGWFDGGTDADSDGGDRSDGADADAGSDNGDDPSIEDAVPGLSDRAVTGGLAAIALLLIGYVFYTRDDPIGTLRSIPGRLVSVALAGVVACSHALERALAALRGLQSIAELPGLVLAAIGNALRSVRTRARAAGSAVSAAVFGGVGEADADAAVEDRATGRERIRQAFESVIDASPMYRSRVATATPADVARSARDAGVPDEPVETITDSFREVEYGDRDPDPYLERTTVAHDRLRDALGSTVENESDRDETGPETGGEADE